MTNCKFTSYYRDIDTQEFVKFDCKENAEESGYCIFHDEQNVSNPENIQKCLIRFNEKVQESVKNNEILFCIGYNLDSVTLEGSLPTLIYFASCKIRTIDAIGPINSTVIFSGTEFGDFVGMMNVEFNNRVDFSQCKFLNGATFSQTKFKSVANFENVMFENDAEFFGCEFSEANFKRTSFNQIANFIDAKFIKEVTFEFTNFKKGAEFAKVIFNSSSNFYGSVYTDIGNFMFTQFLGKTNFQACKFSAGSNFTESYFNGEITFTGTAFDSSAVFLNTTFSGAASFIGVRFESVAAFNISKFNADVTFSRAVFKNRTTFENCIFSSKSDFSWSVSTYIIFSNSQFHGLTNFNHSGFMNEANFSHVIFYNGAEFYDSHFHGEAIFTSAIFNKQVIFNKAEFLTKTLFSKCRFEDKSYFNDLIFSDGERIYFDVGNLSKVSFLNTDLTRVRFGEAVVWGEKDPFKVYDEEILRDGIERYLFDWEFKADKIKSSISEFLKNTVNVEWFNENCVVTKEKDERMISILSQDQEHSVQFAIRKFRHRVILKIDEEKADFEIRAKNEDGKWKIYLVERTTVGGVRAIYRNLRENYEFRLRYDEAGEFFVREMELKRKFRDVHSKEGLKVRHNSWFRRNFSFIGCYYNLSTYGQSILKPILLGLGIFLISVLYWLFYSEPYPISTYHHYIGSTQFWNITHTSLAFERSVNSFVPFLPMGINPILIDIAVRISGFLGLGLLAIALRRKFERKFRH